MKNDENLNKVNPEGTSNYSSDKVRTNIEKNALKKGTEKGLLMAGIISLFIIVTAGIIFYSMYTREKKAQLAMMEDQRSAFTEMVTARDSAINEWVATFDQIERDLRTIREKEKAIAVNSSDVEFSANSKQKILEDIKYINTLIEQNKKKIASLSDQLKKSGNTIKSLETKIADLEVTLQQSEAEITGLKTALAEKDFKIEQLNTKMTDMEVTIAQKEEYISNQTNELNKAFIASGTYKDLKEKGLVAKEGGFLGLGRKESLVENFPAGTFEQIDITQIKTIQVNSKKAKLITEHPVGSYELVREGKDLISYIDIKNPSEFWKISKYAVVEVVK
jgi:hypothetical protein